MKTKKFRYELIYDDNGFVIGSNKIFIKDHRGNDVFKYTASSIFKGAKDFISNKPIDGDKAIRSVLLSNFGKDFKNGFKSFATQISNPSELKNTIKNTFKDTKADIDTIFEKGKKLKNKSEAFKNTGERIGKIEKIMRLTEKITMREFDIKSDTKDILKDHFNTVALYDQISEAIKNTKSYFKDLNINNDRNEINEGKILYN